MEQNLQPAYFFFFNKFIRAVKLKAFFCIVSG